MASCIEHDSHVASDLQHLHQTKWCTLAHQPTSLASRPQPASQAPQPEAFAEDTDETGGVIMVEDGP